MGPLEQVDHQDLKGHQDLQELQDSPEPLDHLVQRGQLVLLGSPGSRDLRARAAIPGPRVPVVYQV